MGTTPRLQQVPAKRQLSAPRATYQTSQDESEVRIAFNMGGAQASDIDLQLDEDKRILRITGETKLEEGELHLSRKFDQTFTLAGDVDMTKATAQFKDNVLTVTAPKVESKVRILATDVVEIPPAIEQAADSETQENQEAAQNENANEKSLTVETDEPSSESVIDLDRAKE